MDHILVVIVLFRSLPSGGILLIDEQILDLRILYAVILYGERNILLIVGNWDCRYVDDDNVAILDKNGSQRTVNYTFSLSVSCARMLLSVG